MQRNPASVWNLWQHCVLTPQSSLELSDDVSRILTNWQKYDNVAKIIGCPAWVVGAIHYRESSFNFNTWLANGDPLFSRSGQPLATVHVPAGLGPAKTWEAGAIASLRHQGWDKRKVWDLTSCLIYLEAYNGWGYAMMGKNSPYIWSGTNQYTSGKYIADGQYDPSVVDAQLGCASLAIGLKIHGVDLKEIPPPA